MRPWPAKFRKYAVAGEVAVRERLAYPGDLAGELLTYGLFVFIFSRIWAVAYSGQADIAGYDRAAATWYFIVTELVFFAGGRSFGAFARDVRDGQIAYDLGRPYGYLLYQYARMLGASLFRLPLFLAVGGTLGVLAVGPWRPDGGLAVAGVVLSFLLAISLQHLVYAVLGLTAFWFEENSAFYWIFSKLALVIGTLVPLEFLPAWLQPALRWLPFPYLTYAPARLAVRWSPEQALELIAGQLVWIVLAAALGMAVFARGARRAAVQGG
jgi:ABC-2 type transport system permease protein